jgi:glyoxylase-like metal-dependent hydrolase (beta-lactamase superfamily II)
MRRFGGNRVKAIGRIGKVEIDRILDSYVLAETAQGFFPDFDREAVKPYEQWLCPVHYDNESGHIPMPVHSWLLRVGDKCILIDTCMGNDKQRPDKFEMHLLNNRYLERMAALGVRPEDVDYVLCTHLHVDHVGWNTRLESGRWVPTFPNARYVLSRAEYETTKKDATGSKADPFLRQVFEDSIHPVVETGKASIVDGSHMLLDGITLHLAPGHSPGHFFIEVRSGGDVGFFVGDIIHSPIQVPLWKWSTRYCWNRDMATKARREILEGCAAENALLIPAHFETPHVGRIREAGSAFAINFGWDRI